MIKLFYFLSLIQIVGCSSIQFSSSNSIPVNLNFKEDLSPEISIEVTKSFYLWGAYPSVQIVEVDKEFEEKGFRSVSDLRIKEIKKNNKFMWMLLTFGMYYPQTFSLLASTN